MSEMVLRNIHDKAYPVRYFTVDTCSPSAIIYCGLQTPHYKSGHACERGTGALPQDLVMVTMRARTRIAEKQKFSHRQTRWVAAEQQMFSHRQT